MKKILSGLLVVCMMLTLAGCAFGGNRTEAEDREMLVSILKDISDNMHPGTAGSSLTAVRLAADIISWASTTKMSKSEAAAIVSEWLTQQGPEIRQMFTEKMENIAGYVESIVTEKASDLLESAGVEKDFSNLGTKFMELVNAVLESAGVDKK